MCSILVKKIHRLVDSISLNNSSQNIILYTHYDKDFGRSIDDIFAKK
jgi:hypothetical protein